MNMDNMPLTPPLSFQAWSQCQHHKDRGCGLSHEPVQGGDSAPGPHWVSMLPTSDQIQDKVTEYQPPVASTSLLLI